MYGKRKPPKPFYLIKRSGSRQVPVYFYRLLDKNYQTIGEWTTGLSSKDAAKNYCYELILMNRLNPLLSQGPETPKTRKKKGPKKVIFGEYFQDFFDYKRCPHIREKLSSGGTYSRQHASNQRRQLLKYIMPTFQSKTLVSISPGDVRKWRNSLEGEFNISKTTANNALRTFKLMLNYAVAEWILKASPAAGIKSLSEDKKTRGILTWKEVHAVFHPPEGKTPWINDMGRVGSLLAACTGMRLSEILALQTDQVRDDHIIVKFALDPTTGALKTPKNGQERIVPICPELKKEILSITHGRNGFIFSRSAGERPVTSRLLRDQFMGTLADLEILKKSKDGKIQNPRNIVFHGLRIWLNTMMQFAQIPEFQVQSILGHRSGQKMTSHYTRLVAEGFRMESMTLQELQRRIINGK